MRFKQIIFFIFWGVLWMAFKSNRSIVGSWQLVKIYNVQNDEESLRPTNYSSQQLTFHFSDNGVEGAIKGFTTKNKVKGKYLLSGSKITVNDFGGTKIAENGWGKEIWNHFSSSENFWFKNDTLIISTEKPTHQLYFVTVGNTD